MRIEAVALFVRGPRQIVSVWRSFIEFFRSCHFSRECIGIIDGDNHTENEKIRYEKIGVCLLPINEIEMLLVSEEVMRHTIGLIYPQDAEDKIEDFKKSFWKKVSEEKEQIALTYTKVYLDEYLASKKIESCDGISSISDSLKIIAGFDVKDFFDALFSAEFRIVYRWGFGFI